MRLSVPKQIYEEMLRHCVAELPNEACGFLGGRGEVVEVLYKLENAAASPVYYRPNDKQMLRAMMDLDDKDLDLVGIFHSHVKSEAYPSPTDVREAHHPDAVFVIVTLADLEDPTARGFKILKGDWRDEEGQIDEIELVVS